MNDYFELFEVYKDAKEIGDIRNEIITLRSLYYSQQFDRMHQYIIYISNKYLLEAKAWNKNKTPAMTMEQEFKSAESFLVQKGCAKLIELGVKLD